MNDILASAIVLAALGMLFTIARLARTRFRLHAEHSRKLVHVGMGLVALSFPWIFSGPAPVIALALLATGVMTLVRMHPTLRSTFGCAIHDVRRRSMGEFAFIAGIALAFTIAHGDTSAYVVPVAVLTFADAIAGIVGTAFGSHRYKVADGWKSLEGSVAFFVIAIACTAIAFMPASTTVLPFAIVASAIFTLIEAVSPYGLDNLLLPVAGSGLIVTLIGAS